MYFQVSEQQSKNTERRSTKNVK